MSRHRISPIADERGGVGPFIMVLLPVFVGFAGLAHDGSELFAARREVTNIAAAAARAGANDVEEASIYAGEPELAPTALQTAQSFAISQGVDFEAGQFVSDEEIRIEVEDQVELAFLGIFGIGTQTVAASADARLQQAVDTP